MGPSWGPTLISVNPREIREIRGVRIRQIREIRGPGNGVSKSTPVVRLCAECCDCRV
jgi:hypothetical protein